MVAGEREEAQISHVFSQLVRSTHSLEVPLAHDNTLLTTTEVNTQRGPRVCFIPSLPLPQYRRHVVDIGNAKLRENLQRVDRYIILHIVWYSE